MAGINTLQEIYEKRGGDWTKEFLSSELRITEKTDAYRFSFEMSRNGKLRFYGKNAEMPLNRIDRTVSDLYEGAISKIEKLPEGILINLPKNHRFGFDWTVESKLSLTDITLRQNGKVTKQIHDIAILEKWANLLHVKWGDELHNGKLDEATVHSILHSLETNTPLLLESAGIHKTYILRGDAGIVKICPPAIRSQKPQKSHSFDLLLLQIYEHIQSLELDKFSFRSSRPDERYIEVVCEAFNHFIADKGLEFLEMGIQKPSFLEKSGKFNKRWIKNTKTLDILETHNSYEYLLSIFLTNLRKSKKPTGLLTESFVSKYNQKISDLDELVRHSDSYGFPEFNSILEKEIEIETNSGFSGDEHIKAIGMLQSYFAMPFSNTNEDVEESKEIPHECCAMVINMGQFTNKVLKECERLLQLNGKSFVLIHDESAGEHCLWGLNPRSGKLAAQQIVKDYPHIFECYESMKHPTLEKINKSAGERKVTHIYTGRSCQGLQKEYESYVTMLGGYIGEAEISQLKGNMDKEITECMEKDDFAKFKDIFPEGVQKFWNSMQTDWNAKAYI